MEVPFSCCKLKCVGCEVCVGCVGCVGCEVCVGCEEVECDARCVVQVMWGVSCEVWGCKV